MAFDSANTQVIQSFVMTKMFNKCYSAEQVDSMHFLKVVSLGLVPFEAVALAQVSMVESWVKKAATYCISPLRNKVAHSGAFAFISVVSGKRTTEMMNFLAFAPRKAARIQEIEKDESPVTATASGLENTLKEADAAIDSSSGAIVTVPLVTA